MDEAEDHTRHARNVVEIRLLVRHPMQETGLVFVLLVSFRFGRIAWHLGVGVWSDTVFATWFVFMLNALPIPVARQIQFSSVCLVCPLQNLPSHKVEVHTNRKTKDLDWDASGNGYRPITSPAAPIY